MAGVGIVLAWFGYSVMYYGINTVTGGNESFMTLVWPGRYNPVARDAGGGGQGNTNKLPNLGPNPLTPAVGGAHRGGDGKCHLFGLSFMPSIPCPPGV